MSPIRRSSARGAVPLRSPAELSSKRRRLAAALTLALLAAGLAIGARLSTPHEVRTESSWRGYRAILMETTVPESKVLAALSAAGFRTVISVSTEPVLVSNWIELETMPLGAALERLVKSDPRRDDYIESLAAWFSATVEGKPYKAYYLPSSSFSEKAISKALEAFRGHFVFPEAAATVSTPAKASWNAVGMASSFSIVIAACLIGSLIDPKTARLRALPRFSMRLAIGAPWIVAAAAGLPMAAIAALWGLALIEMASRLDLSLDEYLRTGSLSSAFDSLKRQALPPLALALSALASTALEPKALSGVGLALSSSIAALASYALFVGLAREGKARLRFVPKPIAAPKASWTGASPWLASLACLAVGLWVFGLLGSHGDAAAVPGSISYPRPGPVEGSARPGLEEVRTRAAAAGADRLPDLASWLEHRALQEALPLERVGSKRSDPFEPVAVSQPGGKVLSLRFDEDWARAAYRSIPSASVEGMLAAQGTSVAAFSGAGRIAASGRGRPLAPIEALRYILFLIPPLGRIAAGLLASRGSGTSETRQEA